MLNPRLFVSYSWTTPEHEEWVLNLATELVRSGVDVIIDKWLLREGHDVHAFIEQMVTDQEIGKVILVCDKAYAEKTNGRKGGVGIEAQIVSGEIYFRKDQSKFVAVITEKDENGAPYLPVYYKSRIYIDLSDPKTYADNFERLLRWIYDKPLHLKPELGGIPPFLSRAEKHGFSDNIAGFGKPVQSVNNEERSSQTVVTNIQGGSVHIEDVEQKATNEGSIHQVLVENITGGNVVFKKIKQRGQINVDQ